MMGWWLGEEEEGEGAATQRVVGARPAAAPATSRVQEEEVVGVTAEAASAVRQGRLQEGEEQGEDGVVVDQRQEEGRAAGLPAARLWAGSGGRLQGG